MIKKSLFLLMIAVVVLALSAPAMAADVIYKLMLGPCNTSGTSGTVGYRNTCYGDVYNTSDVKVGHYFTTFDALAPYTLAPGSQSFHNLHMVELETAPAPWYNFTLNGSYSYGTGKGMGAITNITQFTGSLTGAYYNIAYPTGGSPYYWVLTLHLP
ncbi:MAG: hypothetical protein M0Z79_00250 [Nitrospiraceae bacterium]|nr:hypothetical protein [Nitrospiraceae bacterium]